MRMAMNTLLGQTEHYYIAVATTTIASLSQQHAVILYLQSAALRFNKQPSNTILVAPTGLKLNVQQLSTPKSEHNRTTSTTTSGRQTYGMIRHDEPST